MQATKQTSCDQHCYFVDATGHNWLVMVPIIFTPHSPQSFFAFFFSRWTNQSRFHRVSGSSSSGSWASPTLSSRPRLVDDFEDESCLSAWENFLNQLVKLLYIVAVVVAQLVEQ